MESVNNLNIKCQSLSSHLKPFTIETFHIKKHKNKQGEKIINQYKVLQILGRGSTGVVKLVRNLDTNELYAMKQYSKLQLKQRKEYKRSEKYGLQIKTALEDVRREINIMKNLNHKNIIKLYEIIEEIDGDKIYLIMDYAVNGELMQFVEKDCKYLKSKGISDPICDKLVRKLLSEIISALQYLHRHSIVHRDIKPQNILINEQGSILLADFGSSEKFIENDNFTNTVGTSHFFAPEMLQSHVSYSGRAADIWAVGITLYILIFEQLPYTSDTEQGIYQAIKKNQLAVQYSKELSKDIQNIIFKMLNKKPQNRIKLDEIFNKLYNSSSTNRSSSEKTDDSSNIDDLNCDGQFQNYHLTYGTYNFKAKKLINFDIKSLNKTLQ